jgi:hypothetical protein
LRKIFLAVFASCIVVMSPPSLAKEAGSAPPPPAVKVQDAVPYPELETAFHQSTDWRGADSAYSIPLNAERSVWLFGDSDIGDKDSKWTMINNSASWLDNYGTSMEMKFFWRGDRNKPASVFEPPSSGEWYWPGPGTTYDGNLYVFGKRVRRSQDAKAEQWDFDWYADDLLCLTPAEAEPNAWKQSTLHLPEKNGSVLFGTAVVDEDTYCYVYCSARKMAGLMSPHPAIVARIPKAKLKDASDSDWTFWADEPKMFVETSDRASILFPDAAPEMTVTFIPAFKSYVAVYIPPLTDKILLRTAPTPWGPFSTPVEVYKCPEASLIADGKNVLVYSAKDHPELRRSPKELVITYSCNPGGIAAHSSNPDLCYPRAIKVQLDAIPFP